MAARKRTGTAKKRTGRGRTAAKRAARTTGKSGTRYWSGQVTAHSDALDLESGVFKCTSAGGIARSLKRSAERSQRRKASPFQSAMSMLNFYINRAGKGLKPTQRSRLQAAKSVLRTLYGRPQH